MKDGICSLASCGRPLYAKQLCRRHYTRLRRYGDPECSPTGTLEQRFWSKVDQTGGCWLWIAGKSSDGYGAFHVRAGESMRGAHCVAYELCIGPIPDGTELDHLCRNRGCVNPAHLDPVSHRVNMRRGDAGGHLRRRTHCPRGHAYVGANLHIRPDGRRRCRACQRRDRASVAA